MQPMRFGTPSDFTYLIVCENTPKLHNVIVCTLCSCYPRPLLGMSPAWYMVLPMRPKGTEGWREEKLAGIVTRDTMIGVAVPRIHRTTSSTPGTS
jgi:hypothetical protein